MYDYSEIKILVVDDNFDFRSTLIEYFSSKGFKVFGAENGVKALRLISKNHYDVVLLDLNMPIMDGLETMERIQKKAKNTRIIIVSGKERADKYYYYKRGCILFEKKPIDIVELVYKIKNIIQAIDKRKKKSVPENTTIEIDIVYIYDFVLNNLSNFNLNADFVCEHLDIGKKVLYARIADVLTISLHEMIKYLRLIKAEELIRKGDVKTIKEVSYLVGYRDSGYFTRIFRKEMDKDIKDLFPNGTKRLKINRQV